MDCTHVTHPTLDPIEYYFCDFSSQSDIDSFTKTCPWFNAEEYDISPGEKWVLKVHNAEDNFWYEKLPPTYFKNYLAHLVSVNNSILQAAQQFF